LVLLREGDWGGLVQQASRTRTDGAKYVLFLTSMFWKNAFRYRHYSYRLCSQEAGLVAGNVLAVAQALGLRTRVHYQFLDEPLSRLLGLSPGTESVMSLITLHPEIGRASCREREESGERAGTVTNSRPHSRKT